MPALVTPGPVSPPDLARRQRRRERTLALAAAVLDGPDDAADGRLAVFVARLRVAVEPVARNAAPSEPLESTRVE